MSKLKLGPIEDDEPVKLTIELAGSLHGDLVAYGEALGRQSEAGDPTHCRASAANRPDDRPFSSRPIAGSQKHGAEPMHSQTWARD
jgi:hypothetical protein